MVEVIFLPRFKKKFKKIKYKFLKERVIKTIHKIKGNPEIGKPMRHSRKGTREVYIKPFRFSYSYVKKIETIYLLDLYHKDKQ